MFRLLAFFIETVCLGCFVVAGYMIYDKKIKPLLKPPVEEKKIKPHPDDSMQKILDGTEIMHTLFGPRVNITTRTTAEGRVVGIECRKCGQENRLVRGFDGAVCGKCKHPLVVQNNEFKAAN